MHDGKAACCGRWATGPSLQVVERGGDLYVGGVMRCGRVWLCPTCSTILGQARAVEVADATRRVLEQGGAGYLATFTVRHRAGVPLGHVFEVLNRARAYLMRSYFWRSSSPRLGLVGWVRSTEVTVSRERGWHPHLHVLLLVERPILPADLVEFWLDLARTWADAVARYDPSLRPEDIRLGPGVDVRAVADETADEVASYLFKDSVAGIGMELARPEAKKGRGESLGPFQVGERAAEGDAWALHRWREYEQATRGRHRMQWSRGLRERLGMSAEKTDDELLAESDHDRVVAVLDQEESAALLYAPELGPIVLEAAERGGADEVHRVLAAGLAAMSILERASLRRWGRERLRRGDE